MSHNRTQSKQSTLTRTLRPSPVASLFAVACLVGACAPETVADGDTSSDDLTRTCHGTVALPAGNLVRNPSFESNASGWTGWQASVVSMSDCGAPAGSHVGEVRRTAGSQYTMDDSPDSAPDARVGVRYHATARVRAGVTAAVGRPIAIVIRERTPSGATIVGEQESPAATLTTAFREIQVDYTVRTNGDTIDLYVLQSSAVAGDSFLVDAVSLVAIPPSTDAGVPETDSGSPTPDAGSPDSGSPTPDAGTSPSGEPMPVGDIPGWHQIFADDFNTDVPLGSFPAAVSTQWGAYPDGWHDTTGNGTYDASHVISVSGGLMNMYLHTEGGVHMVAAPMPRLPGATGSGGGLLYGRYTVRFRSDPVPGYKTAWLLWPDSETWPRDGEIDFPEGNLNSTISGFMHRQNGTSGSDQDAYTTSQTYTTWHTSVLEWTATECRFILDGVTLGTSTSRIPDTAMHWVLQTETQLSGGAPSDSAAGNVQIDWVAAYIPQ